MKAMIKKGDILIISFLCIFCALLFAFSFIPQKSLQAKIYYNGEVFKEIELSSLTEDISLEVGGCTVKIEKDGVSFVFSTCKDQLCVKHGKLSKNSHTMACVPNKVVVCIIGSDNENDIVAY